MRPPKTEFSKYALYEHNMTLTDITKITGISYNSIMKYARGIVRPSPERINMISECLGVTPKEIMKYFPKH